MWSEPLSKLNQGRRLASSPIPFQAVRSPLLFALVRVFGLLESLFVVLGFDSAVVWFDARRLASILSGLVRSKAFPGRRLEAHGKVGLAADPVHCFLSIGGGSEPGRLK